MAGNLQQQTRLATLDQATTAKLAELRQAIEVRNARGLADAIEVLRTDRGQAMDDIRRITDSLQEEEHLMLVRRSSEAEAQMVRSRREAPRR